ncbi:hypothetical protein [Tumebacillus flagellatus]|uniref:Uncharacterized protein n=1 Tax=Tumebacillus flagellatus TaxID=1157490 RepID=A0A074LNC7_9BACL|nr:hypothetical protein [Tumebacillus flagellatus]KEO83611.1 hypothetical protein EL26_09370 [Tumebacillus flagellatus]
MALAAFELVLRLAPQISHLAIAAVCSCAVLALSLCRNTYEEEPQTQNLPAPALDAVEALQEPVEVHNAVEELAAEEIIVEEQVVEEQVVEEQVVEEQVVEEQVVEEQVVEEQVVEEQVVEEQVVEEQVVEEQVVEEQVVEEQVVEEQVVEEQVVEEQVVEAQVVEAQVAEEPVVSVSPEWLNEKIAEGYMAKATGNYCGAARVFEEAYGCCTDAGLSAMLAEEIADCYQQASSEELKQGA